MRRFLVLAGLACGALLAVFLLRAAPASAKTLCQCACIDSQETKQYLVSPKTDADKSTGACQKNVCPNICATYKSTQSVEDTVYNPSTNRCVCACKVTTQTAKYASLSSGKTECLGDCSNACGGQANVLTGPDTPKIVTADCAPGSDADCKTGAFSIYEGATCALQPTTEQGWPQNKKPACVIPLTPKNANLECKNYGGIAKGGTCGAVASGENPNSYLKARPFVNPNGSYGVTDYTQVFQGGPSQTPYSGWKALMNSENPDPKKIPANAGICYRLGAIYGGLPTYEGFNPEEAGAGGVPQNDFVCLKKKSNTCGQVAPPSPPIITPGKASFYSCQKASDYLAKFTKPVSLETTCFPQSANYADLCVTYPPGADYRCCPSQKPGQCLTDKDCSLDNSKVCFWPDCNQTNQIELQVCKAKHALTFDYGACVWNTVCDPEHNAAVDTSSEDYKKTPWLFDVRRCRTATPVESANPGICSPESAPPAPKRCPQPGQFCCIAQNGKAISTCASDKASLQGASSVWNDFACIPVSDIPSGQYVTMLNGQKQLKTLDENQQYPDPNNPQGGDCLQSELQKKEGLQVVGTQPRCPTGRYCCNTTAIKKGGGADYKANAQAGWALIGEPCPKVGTVQGFKCIEKKTLGGTTDAWAQEHGFSSLDAYFQALAKSNNCKVTPIESDIFYNKECANYPNDPKDPNAKLVYAPSLCCSDALLTSDFCETDEACNGGKTLEDCQKANPTELSKCKKCDPSLKRCVDSGLYAQNLASDSCFTRAQAKGEAGAQEIANTNKTDPKAFTCQAVFSETPGVFEKCLTQGCDQLPPPGDGSSFKCCIPGIGKSAAAAAAAPKVGAAAPKAAPFTLGLSPCIQSGKCELNDIVYSGAQFANFLIGISGSIFLAIFVYGGFMYLTAGSSNRAAKAKEMIIKSSLAMALILGAYVFISFIQTSLVGSATGQKGAAQCGKTEETKNFACTFLRAPVEDKKAMDAEVQERQCKRGLCPKPDNFVCCPT